MKTKMLCRFLFLGVMFFSPFLARGQIFDGRVAVDTVQYVSNVTGYPVSVVGLFVPQGVITSIINGDSLQGTNLGLQPGGQTVTIGAPNLASLSVNWTYTAMKMADGSGTAVLINVTFKPAAISQGAEVNAVYIVLRPDQVAAAFVDRNAVILAALSNPAWIQYRLSMSYYYPFYYSPIMGIWYGPYYTWYTYTSGTGTVLIGPTIQVGTVP